MAQALFRSDLAIGKATGRNQNRRYVSAPNSTPYDFWVEEDHLATIVESGGNSKRKASMLTPDNAESMLSTSLDLEAFSKRLNEDVTLLQDKAALFHLLTDCIIDKDVSI